MNSLPSPSGRITGVQWLVCIIAAIGFAFDTYELLMLPLVARPALGALLHVDMYSDAGSKEILQWTARIMWTSAVCGGVFGLLGGYLTDLLGRRRVLTWSILLYAVSSTASAFSTSAWMFLAFRCTTFIGVCVEFVAAVAWLSELFPDPHRREAVLGYTQAFASVGGLLVAGAYKICVTIAGTLPAWLTLPGENNAWRYALISGLIPALPLIAIRPFLPESPVWRQKKLAGTLQRPRFGELFQPLFRRTTIVTTLLFACGFGAAFGAIQLVPQIVPGLLADTGKLAGLKKKLDAVPTDNAELARSIKKEIKPLADAQQQAVANVQLYQEVGGLAGRIAMAWLALRIVSRQRLLRLFQIPGLILIPLVFGVAAAGHLGDASLIVLKWGMFAAGFFTIAQFSFWGNYLPRMYPTHLRGTGESFSANVGGRMVGTAASFLTASLAFGPMGHLSIAYAAAAVGLLVYAVGLAGSFWLPEPATEALPE